VSVARGDAAEPYINDFWPGNSSPAVVTRATLHSQYAITSLSTHAEHGPVWQTTDRYIDTAADKSGEIDGRLALEANARAYLDVMAEASGMVMMCEDPAEVGPITDATIEWIDRLTSGRRPPARR
jgi:hypothetical protein